MIREKSCCWSGLIATVAAIAFLAPAIAHGQDAPAYQPLFGPDGLPLPPPAPPPPPPVYQPLQYPPPPAAPLPAVHQPAPQTPPTPAPVPLPQASHPPPAPPAPVVSPQPPPAPAPTHRTARTIRVAVYDLASGGDIKPRTAVIVSEAILAEVRKLDGISAVGMKEIVEMLAFEQKKQFVGCDTVSCLVELAGALGVDELVTGNLGALGDAHVVSVKRLDLGSAETKRSSSKNLKKGDGEEFLAAVGQIVAELYPDAKVKQGAARGVTRDIVARLTTPPLPRWVFFSTAGAAVAAAATGGFFAVAASSYYSDYSALVEKAQTAAVDGAEMQSRKDKVASAALGANVSFIVAGALALAAGAEAFFTDWSPEPVRPTVTPMAVTGGAQGVSLTWIW